MAGGGGGSLECLGGKRYSMILSDARVCVRCGRCRVRIERHAKHSQQGVRSTLLPRVTTHDGTLWGAAIYEIYRLLLQRIPMKQEASCTGSHHFHIFQKLFLTLVPCKAFLHQLVVRRVETHEVERTHGHCGGASPARAKIKKNKKQGERPQVGLSSPQAFPSLARRMPAGTTLLTQ